jgi:hypothetical protein
VDNPTMADDATMFSNPLIAQIQDEEFEEMSLNMNVS